MLSRHFMRKLLIIFIQAADTSDAQYDEKGGETLWIGF